MQVYIQKKGIFFFIQTYYILYAFKRVLRYYVYLLHTQQLKGGKTSIWLFMWLIEGNSKIPGIIGFCLMQTICNKNY